ncbi:MAG: AzlD domain-containing protein, partial [Acidimicrobiales bacterium]
LSGVGTFAMRASFLAAAHRMVEVPPGMARVLRQIPPAALAAIIGPALLRPEGYFDLLQPRLAAGALAALIAWRTRRVGLTLAVGMASLVALQTL